MKWFKTLRPTPAMIVAMVALVVAMSGAAIALPGKGTVSTNDIKKGAITKKLIAKGAVGSQQIIGKSIKGNRIKDKGVKAKQIADATITEKQIADATITGAKVADDGLSDKNISDYEVIGDGSFVKLTATEAASLAGALAAAPETVAVHQGPADALREVLSATRRPARPRASIYARTTTDGAILQGAGGNLPDNDATLLDTDTAEADRAVDLQLVSNRRLGHGRRGRERADRRRWDGPADPQPHRRQAGHVRGRQRRLRRRQRLPVRGRDLGLTRARPGWIA